MDILRIVGLLILGFIMLRATMVFVLTPLDVPAGRGRSVVALLVFILASVGFWALW